MDHRISNIAFLGTGLMGAPMAARLVAAGFRVRVWNRTPQKLKGLVEAGATAASNPREAASGADAVFVCLSNQAALESVLFSADGVARAHRAPALLVDFSTIGPSPTRALAERLRSVCSTEWVDAPVSGGVPGAQQGKLIIFCGGSVASIAQLAPAFRAFAQRYTHAGELGAGQALKLCNQLIVATNMLAIAEALALARASGLDLPMVPEALAGGFADSLPLQIFGTRMAAGVSTPILGKVSMMLKDLRAIAQQADIAHTQLPLAAAALKRCGQAEERGLAQRDLASLIEMY
jgi:3-hydroxyisobutyrate dehydrogenase